MVLGMKNLKIFGQLEEKFEDQTALKSKSFLHLSGTPFCFKTW